jgi:hypothetical protein
VRILRLPNAREKGDVSDWLAAGGTREALIHLVEEAPVVTGTGPAHSGDPAEFGFRTVDKFLSECAAAAERRSFWVGMRAGEVSMLAGRAMAGKSTFACALSRALHLGIPLLGHVCLKAKVGYMALERNGVNVARLLKKWGLGEVHFLDRLPQMSLLELAAFVKAQIVEHGLEVVIVDHLQNFAKIKDSKDYSVVSLALEQFHPVAKETGAHILLLHHQGKTERGGVIDVMGSEAYRAAADTLLEAKAQGEDHFIRGEIRGGDGDLPRTKVRIDLETGEVQGIDAHQAEMDVVLDDIRRWLQNEVEAATMDEIQEALKLKRETINMALEAGVVDAIFERTGTGRKGSPYRFQLHGFSSQRTAGTAGTESESARNPNAQQDLFSSRPSGNGNADREPNPGAFEDLE